MMALKVGWGSIVGTAVGNGVGAGLQPARVNARIKPTSHIRLKGFRCMIIS